jgi:hypothetical protein
VKKKKKITHNKFVLTLLGNNNSNNHSNQMQEFNGTLSLKVSREDTLGAKRNPMRANK